MANERGHTLEHHNNSMQRTNGYRHDDNDTHVSTCAYAHSTPTYVPYIPFPFLPAPIPFARDSPNSNQQGHVTVLDNHAPAFNNNKRALANIEQLTDHPTTAQPSTYTYLETLHRDCNNGMPSAVAFMQG